VLVTMSFAQQTNTEVDKEIKKKYKKKTLGLILGMLPNSDGFLDNQAGFNLYYSKFKTSFNFISANRTETIKANKKKKNSGFEEKNYDLLLWGMQKDALDLGFTFFSFGLGSAYKVTNEQINSTRTIATTVTFTDEERESIFIQPYIQLAFLFRIGKSTRVTLGGNGVPYQLQNSSSVSQISGVEGKKTQETEDKGLEFSGYLRLEAEYPHSLYLLESKVVSRAYITTIETGTGTNQIFETATSSYRMLEFTGGYGFKFLTKFLDGAYPILTFSYVLNDTTILAEKIKNDQTISKNQWKVGFLIKLGAL